MIHSSLQCIHHTSGDQFLSKKRTHLDRELVFKTFLETREYHCLSCLSTPSTRSCGKSLYRTLRESWLKEKHSEFYQNIVHKEKSSDLSWLREIFEEELEVISNFLCQNTTVSQLRIVNARVKDSGCVWIGRMLYENTSLKVLSLRGNEIGDEGIIYISDSLKLNTTLQGLNLFANRIRSKGFQHLSKTLTLNSTLKSLWVGRNQLGEGLYDLMEALKSNTSLESLDLSFTGIQDCHIQLLSECFLSNTALVSVFLGNNNLPEWVKEWIEDKANSNPQRKKKIFVYL